MCDRLHRVPRTLREAFPDPRDWIEGPRGRRPELEQASFSPQFWVSLRWYLAVLALVVVAILAWCRS